MGLFGVRTSLLADAVTFLVSALITKALVRARPAARGRVRGLSRSDFTAGIRLVFRHPALRTPMLLGWLVAFYNVPEGVGPRCRGHSGAGTWPRG